jgi:hypothetical protein
MSGLHRKRKRPPTTTEQYAGMLRRMLNAYGKRIGETPIEGLTHLRELEQALTDATNLGIWSANKEAGHSINELADVLGVSKQAIYKRVLLGEQVAKDHAKRERQAVTAQVAKPRELPSGQD